MAERPTTAPRPGDPPGRLSNSLERLDRLPTDELRLLAVRPLDASVHDAARGRALEAARSSGRADRLDVVTGRIAVWLDRAFGTRSYDPTWVALAWRHEPLRLEDRGRLRETLDDAALAMVIADPLDEAAYGERLGPCPSLAGEGA